MNKKPFAAIIAAALLGAAGCSATEAQPVPELLAPSGALEDSVTVGRGDIWEVSRHDGIVRAREEELSFGDVGDMRILSVHVIPGQSVSRGDVLIRLDAGELEEELEDMERELSRLAEGRELALELARADIAVLELELKKLESDMAEAVAREPRDWLNPTLRRSMEVKELEIEKARALLEQEEQRLVFEEERLASELEAASAKLSDAALTAPFDGVAVHVNAEHGALARPFETAVLLADHSRLFVEMTSAERFLPDSVQSISGLSGNRSYSLAYEPLPREEVLEYLSEGGAVPYRFTIEEGEEAPPRPGDYFSIMVTRTLVRDALRLPVNAVYRSGGSYVYLKTGEGAAPAYVETGRSNDSYIEILSGLSEGDVVVIQ
jgi:multidrug efflux pump subunit AcrA (membrane-fusion protein)